MKKVSVLFFLALLILIPSCKNKGSQSDAENQSQEGNWSDAEIMNGELAENTPPVKPGPTMKGVMISGWYYDPVYNEDGSVKTMSANFEARVGTEVEVYGSYDSDDENMGAEMLKDVPIDGAKKNFIHVRYDGEEYYVRDYAVAVNAVTAIVTNSSAYKYTKPNLANMGKDIVPESTLVAVFSAPIPEDEDDLFKKIRYYVPDGKTYTVNGYLTKNSLSFNKEMIAAEMISERLESLRAAGNADETVLDELLETLEFLRY